VIVFLDTNIVIYYIEGPPEFGPRAVQAITDLRAGKHTFAVSDLVVMESRVHPIRNNDLQTLAQFDGFFSLRDVQVFKLTTAVCQRATHLRAKYNIKTPDALQLGAAIVHGCDRFLTADSRLSSCIDIPIDVLP
jgi:predicted nucleic acid-binding protein